MSLQVEKLEKNMAKLTIEVPAEDLEKGMEKAINNELREYSFDIVLSNSSSPIVTFSPAIFHII